MDFRTPTALPVVVVVAVGVRRRGGGDCMLGRGRAGDCDTRLNANKQGPKINL